jgi:hypothetical protein
VINVQVPYEGELERTDAFAPYLEIVGDTGLPAARDAEILLYCRSERMSPTPATPWPPTATRTSTTGMAASTPGKNRAAHSTTALSRLRASDGTPQSVSI